MKWNENEGKQMKFEILVPRIRYQGHKGGAIRWASRGAACESCSLGSIFTEGVFAEGVFTGAERCSRAERCIGHRKRGQRRDARGRGQRVTSGDVYPTNRLREAIGEVGRCEGLLRPSHGREGWGDGAGAGAKSLEVGNEKNADERRIC